VEKRLEVDEDDITHTETDGGDEHSPHRQIYSTSHITDPDANEEESSDQFFSLTSNEDGEISDTNAPSVTWTSSSSSASPPGSPRDAPSSSSPTSPPLPPEMIAELEVGKLETAHLEHIDAAATKAEEARLFALLKLPVPVLRGDDAHDVPHPKPPKLPPRKRKEPKDLVAWYDKLLPPNPESNRRVNSRFSAVSAPGGEYISEWQAYCGHIPASAFVHTQQEWTQSRKRKRAEERQLLDEQTRKRTRLKNDDMLDETDESGSENSGKDAGDDSDDSEDTVDEEDVEEREELVGNAANGIDDADDLILDAYDSDEDANNLDDLLVQQTDSSEDSEDENDGATTTSQGTEAEEQDDYTRDQSTPGHAPGSPPPAGHLSSRPRRSAAPSELQINVHGEEDVALPAYLAHRLGGIVGEDEEDSVSEGELVEGEMEDEL